MISIRISNNTLNIDTGNFKGDVEEVRKELQAFANKNSIKYSGFRGYGTLTVNEVKHAITPYGIDIEMMLEFCGLENPAPTNHFGF